jgi:hypothetical protein
MDEGKLLERIIVNPGIFGGKPSVRGRRLAVEHVLGCSRAERLSRRSFRVIRGWSARMSRPGSSTRRIVGHERVERW